ncbi:MAG: sulfurtransferase TusA family protein [Chloroflexota bacterium]
MAFKQLDVRGEICPYPMMKTVQALKKLQAGDEGLEVFTDHPPALETIPTQAVRLGFETKIEENSASEWRIVLTRAG